MTRTAAAVVIVACTQAACSRTPNRPIAPARLVPETAVAMVELQWQRVIADPALRQFAGIPPAGAILPTLGLSLDSAERIVGFSSSLNASGNADTLIIQSPTLVRQFRAAVERGDPQGTHRRRAAYMDPGSGLKAIAVTDDVLVVGRGSSVSGVVAVAEGEAAAFLDRDEVREMGGVLDRGDPVSVAIVWPTAARDVGTVLAAGGSGLLKLAGFGAIGSVVSEFGIGRGVALSCSHVATVLRCRLAGVTGDARTASLISGGINVLKGLASLGSSSPGPASQISNLAVERRGAVVLVDLSVPIPNGT